MTATQETGLAAAFFTIAFFTAVGFMVRWPLDDQGRKAVIRYLALGCMLAAARDVMADTAALTARQVPEWWPAALWLLAAVMVAAETASQKENRCAHAAGTVTCTLLILFCMGVSYVTAASFTALTGLWVPWSAASLIMAALLRNTTELTQEEFPDGQCEMMRRVSLCVMATTLVMPA